MIECIVPLHTFLTAVHHLWIVGQDELVIQLENLWWGIPRAWCPSPTLPHHLWIAGQDDSNPFARHVRRHTPERLLLSVTSGACRICQRVRQFVKAEHVNVGSLGSSKTKISTLYSTSPPANTEENGELYFVHVSRMNSQGGIARRPIFIVPFERPNLALENA
jgi:hypothetical protein